jgi:hypothetical protein
VLEGAKVGADVLEDLARLDAASDHDVLTRSAAYKAMGTRRNNMHTYLTS